MLFLCQLVSIWLSCLCSRTNIQSLLVLKKTGGFSLKVAVLLGTEDRGLLAAPLEAMGRFTQATSAWRQALDKRLSKLTALEWATIVGIAPGGAQIIYTLIRKILTNGHCLSKLICHCFVQKYKNIAGRVKLLASNGIS
jgi:hypothetical protein